MSRRVQIVNVLCNHCRYKKEILSSTTCVFCLKSGKKNAIFAHNGNLISYYILDSFSAECLVCFNPTIECVYTKDGNYYTLSKYSGVTVINCVIKKPLQQNSVLIIGTDIGIFVNPNASLQKLLFVRGIKIDYKPQQPQQSRWVYTVYSQFNGTIESSADNLAQSIFTCFKDDDGNIYLIDRNGNSLEYETLLFTGEEYTNPSTWYMEAFHDGEWKIYANDKMRVKTHGYYESAEILEDNTHAGKHTKPALH